MLTGYNTDFLHRGVVLHVQTEDKGEANPWIESLIYIGGRVVAVERSSYEDLVSAGADLSAVAQRMDAQHTALIHAVQGGEYDERLKDYLPTGSEAAASGDSAPADRKAAAAQASLPDALDRLVGGYLENEVSREVLELTVQGEFTASEGRPTAVQIMLRGSNSGNPISDVDVWAEFISTVAEPRVLARSRSDANGGARLQFEVPALQRGTGAVIIAAESAELGRAELQHLL